MFGIDKVVAREYISVVFHHTCVATFLGHGAHSGWNSDPICQRCVEKLHEIVAHIMPHPLVKDGT